ncbi:MAG: transcription antitermination factor NusB [Nocardioidaceae bacterium]
MSARTKARKRALDILFESELRGLGAGGTLADRTAGADPPLNPYTVTLVEGVTAHTADIDALISELSSGWSLARMPAVDRNILRVGVFELRHGEGVPSAVAISEAVALAKELSTDESPAFVNGVLAKVAAVPSPEQVQ